MRFVSVVIIFRQTFISILFYVHHCTVLLGDGKLQCYYLLNVIYSEFVIYSKLLMYYTPVLRWPANIVFQKDIPICITKAPSLLAQCYSYFLHITHRPPLPQQFIYLSMNGDKSELQIHYVSDSIVCLWP